MSPLTGPAPKHALTVIIVVVSLVLYVSLAPLGYALFALIAALPTRRWTQRARRLQRVMQAAFGAFHRYLRLARLLDFTPRDVCPANIGACVVVANHPTLTDAPAMLSSIPNLCTAVRADLYDKPWLRPLLGGAGHFSAGAENPLGGADLVRSTEERLADGFRVLLFPEGTRSPRGRLHRFGRSAFEAACRARVPIVAVLIRETPPWLAKGDGFLTRRREVAVKHIELLKVVYPRDFLEDSRLMRDYVEAAFQQALGFGGSKAEAAPPPPLPEHEGVQDDALQSRGQSG